MIQRAVACIIDKRVRYSQYQKAKSYYTRLRKVEPVTHGERVVYDDIRGSRVVDVIHDHEEDQSDLLGSTNEVEEKVADRDACAIFPGNSMAKLR